jgi:SAM-dependent methyltransferase
LTVDLDGAFRRLSELTPELRPSDLAACLSYHRGLVQPFFMATPWGRRVVVKPLGYAGDFAVVESIYDGEHAAHGDGALAEILTRYLMGTGPTRAHRARLPWAHGRLAALEATLGRPLRVLSFACGPERVLREYVAAGHAGHLVLCDFEPQALAYCRRRFRKLLRCDDGTTVDYVELAASDVFTDGRSLHALRERAPGGAYDAVLVLGLLDYLSGATVAPFLDGLASLLESEGELLVTNMHVGNPWRSLMEYEGDWWVVHRTREELRDLATGPHERVAPVELRTDPSGVNLLFAGVRP